ncbi:MAG: hypothetical protein ACE5GW_04260, partial [Planctomycetota bacterium]
MDSPIEGLSGQAAALRPRTARLLLGLAGALAATAIAGFFAAGMASGDEEAGGSTGRGIVDRIRRLEQEIM